MRRHRALGGRAGAWVWLAGQRRPRPHRRRNCIETASKRACNSWLGVSQWGRTVAKLVDERPGWSIGDQLLRHNVLTRASHPSLLHCCDAYPSPALSRSRSCSRDYCPLRVGSRMVFACRLPLADCLAVVP